MSVESRHTEICKGCNTEIAYELDWRGRPVAVEPVVVQIMSKGVIIEGRPLHSPRCVHGRNGEQR